MVKRNKKLVRDLSKTEVQLEAANNACKKLEEKYAALSESTERIVSSFKDLEKTAKRTKSGYFKLKRILK
jgi:predicted nuclease with TOPRIM domain